MPALSSGIDRPRQSRRNRPARSTARRTFATATPVLKQGASFIFPLKGARKAGTDKHQNLIMSLRVNVTFGPMPPVPCASNQTLICSKYVFSEVMPSTGAMTLKPRSAAALAV